MLNFSKYKIIFIVSIILFSLYFSIPSFINNNEVNIVNNSTNKNNQFINFLNQVLSDKKVNMGLDLQGGSQILLNVDFDYYLIEQLDHLADELNNQFKQNNINSNAKVIDNKINFNSNSDEIKTVKNLLKKISYQLEINQENNDFTINFSDLEIRQMQKKIISQSIEIIRRRVDETGTKEPLIQAQGNNRILLQVPGVKNTDELKQIIGKTAKLTFHFLASNQFSSTDNFIALDNASNQYILNKDIVLSGEMLVDANTTYHEGQPAVFFKFNSLGAKKFAQITKENIGRIFAIVLDGKVVTAPRINTTINQGSGVISGSFTVQEANQVSLLLRAGALPAPLSIAEERTVGPSLGLDSIKSGKISSLMGLIFVAIFMTIFYGLFGIFANIALAVNLTIIISTLAILNATLTLPGIAGIVLTMGMAVDANVLIFERIKEELKSNKSIFQSVEQGFNQAYRTIIDSNLTTLIVAFFLFTFGNGSIKGFAVTLSIGIISSMFTAIMLTRMMIAIWLKKYRPKKISLI
jgi:preprotein translocase subunit SecD